MHYIKMYRLAVGTPLIHSNTKVVLRVLPVKAKFQGKEVVKSQRGGVIAVPLTLRLTLDKFLNGI
jgi:hypothetical protein